MRRIDADALMNTFADRLAKVSERYGVNSAVAGAVAGAMGLIEAQPTIGPERKTGQWVIKETAYGDEEAKCSCCGFEILVNQPGNGLHMVNDLHFCPNCGAYMRGEQE